MTARRLTVAAALVGASLVGFGGGRATAHPSPAPVTVCRALADGSVHAYVDPDAVAVIDTELGRRIAERSRSGGGGYEDPGTNRNARES